MIIEIDELNFARYTPAQLAAVRPDMERLATITRRNLRLLDGILGINTDPSDLAREHDRLCLDLHEAHTRIEALEHDLATARTWIKHLQRTIAAAEDDEEEDALYRSVGLTPTVHTVVIAAARRALLQHYHPDQYAPDRRAAATASFQAASAAFDRIAEVRAC